MKKIHGFTVDKKGRCVHYNTEVDIIANKCYDCRKYYACYHCHNELEQHPFSPWPIAEDSKEKIVLCGVCRKEMTYEEYKKASSCVNCNQQFNENCSMHRRMYFLL